MKSGLGAALLLGGFGLLHGHAAFAQAPVTAEVVAAAAEALGMVRGPQRRMDSINTVQYSATGTQRAPGADGEWADYEITNVTVGISYYIPAMRTNFVRVAADGTEVHEIHVVRGSEAWNEVSPGVGAIPTPGLVQRRLQRLWLTPHGVIRAAVENPEGVQVGTSDGQTTLTVEIDGVPVTATLDAASRPARVSMPIAHPVLGDVTLEALYSDYVDWPKLDVYFPSQIVQRLDGTPVLDLTVTEFFQNPYVVFPTPVPVEGVGE